MNRNMIDENAMRDSIRAIGSVMAGVTSRFRALRHAYSEQRETIITQAETIDQLRSELKSKEAQLNRALRSLENFSKMKNETALTYACIPETTVGTSRARRDTRR